MATKITSNEASLVLNDGKSTIPRGDFTAATNPKGMVQVRSNNLVVTWDLDPTTTTVDGESFDTGKELADKLSSFSIGGGTGEGVQWDDVENKPLKTLETPIEDSEGLIPVYTQNGQLPVGIPEFPENAVPLVYLDQRLSELGGAKVESFQHTAAGGMGETFTHNTGDPTIQAVVLVPQNQSAIESGDPIYAVADGIITITVTATSAGDVLEYSYVAGTDISESSILDDLTSTATDKALSANQGRVLDDKIKVLRNSMVIDYSILSPISTEAGYYSISTGLFMPNASYTSKKYDVSALTEDLIYASGTINGSPTALVLYLDENNQVISYEERGSNGVSTTFNRKQITIPNGSRYAVISTINTGNTGVLEKGGGSLVDLRNQVEMGINEISDRISVFEEASKLINYIEQSGVQETTNGFYRRDSNLFTASANYRSQEFDISNLNRDSLYLSATVSGGPTALAVYLDENGNYIGSEKNGSNGVNDIYNREKLFPPANARKLRSTSVLYYSSLEIGEEEIEPISREIINDLIDEKINSNGLNSQWKDKTIWWAGTSIPAGGWPQLLDPMLGTTVINVAQGSSMIRRGKIDQTDGYGWTGLAWQNVAYSLSQTLAEKNELINNWDYWRTVLTNTPPTTLTDAQKNLFRSCSYEQRLIPYLDGTNVMPDLFVLDHGHNDNLVSDTDSQYTQVPAVRNDRNYFLGAINFIVDEILKYNPRAMIIFMGHYENARKTRISIAQSNISEYWDFPICKLWERLGWTQQIVQTTGYWSDASTWVPSGGSLTSKTITQIWMFDDLHPSSLPTRQYIANRVKGWIDNI